jgi:hypothetical protein
LPAAFCTVQVQYTVTQNDIDTNGGGDGMIENTATGDTEETTPEEDTEIVPLEAPVNLAKSATEAVDNGDGTYDVTYTITATNQGAVASSYDVIDQLTPSGAVTSVVILNATAYQAGSENSVSGTIETVTAGELLAGVTLVTNESLGAGLTEAWTFTIRYTVDSTQLTQQNADCANDEGEDGNTGFANNVSGSSTDTNPDDNRACVPIKAIVMAANAFCENDVPWVNYSVNVFGIPGFQASDINYSFVNVEDNAPNEIVVAGPTPLSNLSGDLLWPGATADGPAPGANGLSWPGWTEAPPGTWTSTNVPETPNLVFRMQINPTDEVAVIYPPALPICNAAPPASLTVSKTVESIVLNGNSVDVTYRASIVNSGGQLGIYNLIDKLMVDPSLIPTAVINPVTYQAGTENNHVGSVNFPTAAEFGIGTILVVGETLAAGRTESFVFTLRFDIDQTAAGSEGMNCEVTDENGGYTGVTNQISISDGEIIISEDEACEIFELPDDPRTTFTVTKDFTDDNPMEVEVKLDCNTGLILDQEKLIAEGEYVEFIVTDFTPGNLTCHVRETVPNGYTPDYQSGTNGEFIADSVSDDAQGCHFEEVESGLFTCHIVNTPLPVEIEIEKEWVIEGMTGDVDTYFELALQCDSEIIGGTEGGCAWIDQPVSEIYQSWCLILTGNGPTTFYPEVVPKQPSTHCTVAERALNYAVEVENGCTDLEVSAGQGTSCVVTNTVFFEGIPTLSELGKLLMILMVLGTGLMVYRRNA